MKFCSKCGHELIDEAVVCTNCGCAVSSNATSKINQEDKPSVGLCVLSALIPLFGIIYWPVCHSKTPIKARYCGITGIISWAVCFVLYILIAVFGIFAALL